MKNSKDWNEADLLALIDQSVEESITLDYKQCEALANTDGKKREIAKDVSAFANSAGGVLIYGIKEVSHVATELDIGFDPNEITKEWLEQVIQGGIRPRISDVHINPVQLNTRLPGKVVYVVTIPQSSTAHQASDKRYYKRFNFESAPMEDHEIRDVMNRLRFPLLLPQFSNRFVDRKGTVYEYVLNVAMTNKGAMAAHLWKLVLWIPVPLSVKAKGFARQQQVEFESTIYGKDWFKQWLHPVDHVIFPDDEWQLSLEGVIEFVYKIDVPKYSPKESREPFLLWMTYADNMPPQDGKLFLAELNHES